MNEINRLRQVVQALESASPDTETLADLHEGLDILEHQLADLHEQNQALQSRRESLERQVMDMASEPVRVQPVLIWLDTTADDDDDPDPTPISEPMAA